MAALTDAELDIEGGADPASARAAALATAAPAAFADGCRRGAPYQGLCTQAVDAGDIHLALADGGGPGIVFGAFTGARMPAGSGALAARAPRYLIERMPSAPDSLLYRITALGFGSAGTTQVGVQAYYRKLLVATPAAPSSPAAPAEPGGPETGTAPPAPGMPGGPGVRVSWREIANWHDGVAAGGASSGTGAG